MYPESKDIKQTQCRRGFTLLELMVVLVILGLLAGTVVFKTRSYLLLSKQNAAKMEIAKISQALETFYAAYDRYPTNEEGLQILASKSDKFPDGLLNKCPRDPWGNPYQYNNPGKHGAFDVICYGADGREGGDGADQDIANDEDTKNQTK
jgi:general secretion pathway protein G